MEEASRSEGGLAVMSVLVDVGEAHTDVAAITDLLSSVQYKGETVQLDGEALDLVGLLPGEQTMMFFCGFFLGGGGIR